MAFVFLGFGWILVGLALAGAGYALFAAFCVRRFMAARGTGPAAHPPVSILKPLHRCEPGLFENLESFCRQHYSGPVQIVFGVHDANDPAVAVVKALQARYPQFDTAIAVEAVVQGANAKVSNLISIMAVAKYDTLVLADSDIAVPPHWLAQVTAALQRPGVGVVTCLYTGEVAKGDDGLWSRLAAMGTSYDFLPNVVVGTSLGLASPCFGSTIALTRETLEDVGGFAAFADCLADDYEIGRAVRAKGLALTMPALAVAHTATEPSFVELFRHERRWRHTIHRIDPAGNIGSIVTFGFAFALMGAVMLDFSAIGLAAMAATLAARLILKWRIDHTFGTNAGPFWLMPLRDLLSFAVFVNALFGETVHWRGARFEIAPSGAMTQSVN
jgi:ceramide glucosyltransferase